MSDWDSGTHAGPKIGRTLELARKERGLSLERIEEATKIRASYLKELERDNFDVLPAVYVQGSLRTYANFLQLDGEALVQKLKRHQAQEPTHVESRDSDFVDRALRALDGAAVVGSRGVVEDEKDTGSKLLPAGVNRYLYLLSGAFLVLAAIALVLILPEDEQPAVSQVRAPLISQAPEPSSAGGEEAARANQSQREDERGTDDEGDDPQPEQSTKPPDEDTGDKGADRTAQTGQNQANSSPAPAEPEAAPTSPTTETPTRESDASAPAAGSVNQNNKGPQTNVRGAGGTRNAPADGSRRARPGSRNGGDFDVRVEVGSDGPVRITGNVPGVDGGRR